MLYTIPEWPKAEMPKGEIVRVSLIISRIGKNPTELMKEPQTKWLPFLVTACLQGSYKVLRSGAQLLSAYAERGLRLDKPSERPVNAELLLSY